MRSGRVCTCVCMYMCTDVPGGTSERSTLFVPGLPLSKRVPVILLSRSYHRRTCGGDGTGRRWMYCGGQPRETPTFLPCERNLGTRERSLSGKRPRSVCRTWLFFGVRSTVSKRTISWWVLGGDGLLVSRGLARKF